MAGWLVLVGLLAVLALRSVPELAHSALGSPAPYAAGAVGEDRSEALDRVVLELWRVRSAMDRYVRDHDGLPPRALADLEGVAPVCPASGRPWVYETDAQRYRVSCPEPGALDRGSVFLDWRVGPPQVSLRPIGGLR